VSQNIFISYSRKNETAALTLAERLRSRGLSVWIDQKSIGASSRWTGEIAKAVEEATVMLLLISSDSMASENVLKEVDMALEWKKRIVPIDIEKIPLTRDFMYHLVGRQRVDFNDFEAIYQACLKPIESTIVRPASSTSTHTRERSTIWRSFATRLRGWKWYSWAVLLYSAAAFLQVTEALIQQGQNGLPNVEWSASSEALTVTQVTAYGKTAGYHIGDQLISFDGLHVGKGLLTDAFYDAMKRHRAGDVVPVIVARNGVTITIQDRLRNDPMPNERWYGALACAVAFLIVMFLFVQQPAYPQMAFFTLVMANSLMFVMPPFNIPLPKEGVGFPGILTLVGPLQWLTGIFLLQFACYYLRPLQRRWILIVGYLIVAPSVVAAVYNAIGCLFGRDIRSFEYLPAYVIDADTSTATLLFAAIVVFIVGYIQTKERGVRKRIRVMLWAMSVAVMATIVLELLPPLGVVPFVPHRELILLATLLLTMLGMTFSFARIQVVDFDVVINRTIVYVAVLAILLGVYSGVNGILDAPALSAIAFAMLFAPFKLRVQKFVDRRFFKLAYNYRQAEHDAATALTHTGSVLEVGEYIVGVLTTMLPTNIAAFFTIDEAGGITFISSANAGEPERYRAMGEEVHRRLIEFGPEAWNTSVGLPDLLEPDTKAIGVEDNELRRLGAALLTPVRTAEGGLKGFFLSGRKTNGWKFSAEDINLLQSISVLTTHALARIEHHAEAQLQEAERARFERRRKVKSISGSSLPHEIWVMGDNIQTLRAIELKQLAYGPQSVDIDALVRTVLQSLSSDLLIEQFEVDLQLHADTNVQADPKLLEQSIRTILSHAMKYSSVNRKIDITTETVGANAILRITDHGVGMSADEQAIVFEPFRRGASKSSVSTGAGIGLYVVKHVVEACGGRVELESALGKGTVVSLVLPVMPNLALKPLSAFIV
jgi:hypothetical protein